MINKGDVCSIKHSVTDEFVLTQLCLFIQFFSYLMYTL